MHETSDRFVSVILKDVKHNCLKLPSLPEIAMRVRRTVEDEDSTAAQIAKLVGVDAALSARLLRVANSSMYRGDRPIENLQTAVARLGGKVIRSLVSSLVVQQLYQSPSSAVRQRMKELWSHSIEVAAMSHLLAARFTSLDPEQAMLAGLLHDIGGLPILSRAEDFPEILAEPRLLEEALDKLHVVIGKLILERWNFPADIVAAVAEHEDLSRYTAVVDYVDIVQVANLHSYIGKPHRLAHVNFGDVPAFAKLGLTPDQSMSAIEEAKAGIAEMRSLLAA
ncbi:MAG: HDOD domain-containing protein [Gammaproteobacteria bacterium]|nr:MAG: HDOD domain-containing protein [Gammaproteobacteria bacterium]